MSRQTGEKIVHTSVGAAERKAVLTGAGVPEAFADVLVDVDVDISRGALSVTPGDLSRLIGRTTSRSPIRSPPPSAVRNMRRSIRSSGE